MESRGHIDSAPPNARPVAGKAHRPGSISQRFTTTVCTRLAENLRVRRNLPIWGRVHIDRQLPFLCLYRQKEGSEDAKTEKLLMGEASYLIASGRSELHKQLSLLVRGIVETLTKQFGAFLLVEIWEGDLDPGIGGDAGHRPGFRIVKPLRSRLDSTINALEESLGRIVVRGHPASIELIAARKAGPEKLPRFLSDEEAVALNCHTIGVGVAPIYRDAKQDRQFPLVMRALHRGFSLALKRGCFEFVRSETTHRPKHYLALGRRSIVKAVFAVDRELAGISNDLEFLLAVSPTNTEAAWRGFRRSRFEVAPAFVYRRLAVDPVLMKRRLFSIPIERIEDPALAQIFRDQQAEFDRKLTMLMDLGSRRFLHGSLQLFGGVEEKLSTLARDLLQGISTRARDEASGRSVDCDQFAARAEQEIERYRGSVPGLPAKVFIRDDLSGLMVSHGSLLVGRDIQVPESRVDALLAHEVGTHLVTYYNGRTQPFQQLYVGLPGYEELQEGLAVLAEHLAGGLSRSRLRLLAARVVGVEALIGGATFVELFRILTGEHRFPRRAAFGIAARIFRGGGLTKDAVYLRGLRDVLDYFKQGEPIERLYAGKFGFNHLDFIRELEWRQILNPASLRARYLEGAVADERIRRLRAGTSIMNLVERTQR